MSAPLFPRWSMVAAWVLAGALAKAEIVTYPAPPGEALAQDYRVEAQGKKVDVYTARTLDPPFAGKEWDFGGPYCFANLDTSGPVTVRIASKRLLRNTVVRPQSPGVKLQVVDDHTVTLELDGPRKLSIEPDGKKGPLLLFANPPEREVPKPGDPGVVYFRPGIHRAGRIDVTSGQTVYLAGGAVVKGAIAAKGSNIRIFGRGILDGSDYEWRKGPYNVTIGIQGENVTVEGITIRGSSHWTIVPRDSRHVTVRNVKLCNSRVQNDDGINPCNSQDVLVTDCFIRSDDDCVALKGLNLNSPNNNVERITVENCTLWCDRARVFLLGHESRAAFMRQVTLRNLDIIHFSMTAFLLEPGEDMRLEDVTVQNVRIHGEGQAELLRLKPVVNQYMRKKVPGFIRNVRFKDVEVTGRPGPYRVQLSGADPQHDVQGVRFENVSILGKELTRTSPQVTIGKYVEGVEFVNPSFERRVIDPQGPKNPWVKVVGDLDKDSRPDVIIGGASGPLVWYANPSWRKSTIAAAGYNSVDGEAADIDGDGDLDLVIGGVVWYENPLPKAKPDSGSWAAHRIADFRTHDVEVADLDGDGKLDVVVRDQSGFGHKTGNRIMLYRQRAPHDWAASSLACPHGEGLKVADLNRDGRPDIAIGSRWYKNPGMTDAPWAEHVYAAAWKQEDAKVEAGDLDGDGRTDVVLAPAEYQGGRYRIAWFEAPADPRKPGWKEHVIEPQIETVIHSLGVADMNGDGTPDVVTAMMHQGSPPQEVGVYLNAERGQRWSKVVMSTKGSHNLVLADLDGDGRIDVLGANHGGPYQPVEWWRNLLAKPDKQIREVVR